MEVAVRDWEAGECVHDREEPDRDKVAVMEAVGLWRVQEGVLLSLCVKLVSLGLSEKVFDTLSEP